MWVLKIQIKSNQAIQITSEQDIQFQAASVNLTAKEEISLEGKGSSFILDNETHFKSSKVSELGIPVPVMYQERMMPITKKYNSSKKKEEEKNFVLDLLGYYDAKKIVEDVKEGEVGLDTVIAGASFTPPGKAAKAIKTGGKVVAQGVKKVGDAIGNVGKKSTHEVTPKLSNTKSKNDSISFKKISPNEIEKKYNLKRGQFHREVKQDILKELTSKNSMYKDEMKKMGKNPDIYLSSNGQIQIVSTQHKGRLFKTNWNIKQFLP